MFFMMQLIYTFFQRGLSAVCDLRCRSGDDKNIMATNETRLLSAERQKVSFVVEDLTNVYDGGKHETVVRRKVGSYFAFQSKHSR